MREELIAKIVDEIVFLNFNKKMLVDVSFVDKETIKDLNCNYRNIDKETDVLSFSMIEGEFGNLGGEILGDVIICKDVVKKMLKSLTENMKKSC